MVDDVDEEGPCAHGRIDDGDVLASVAVLLAEPVTQHLVGEADHEADDLAGRVVSTRPPSQFRVVGAQKALVQVEVGVSGLVLEHLGVDGR
ncbi:hypothetical protein RKD31_006330 [Streptomyces sp. SAI-163]